MKTTHFFLLTLLVLNIALRAQNPLIENVQVTFYLDMQNEIISSDGVFVKGNWDDWSDSYELIEAKGSEVFSVTLPMPSEQRIEYKFYNGNPGNEWYEYIGEDFLGVCTDEWTNRFFQVPAYDVQLDTVCFNSCDLCLPSGKVEITFRVDMQSIPLIDDSIYLIGTFNNWGNPVIRLSADGTVYSTSLKLLPNEQVEYKFMKGEEIEANISGNCTTGNGNRSLTVPATNEVLEAVCFNRCTVCDTIDPDKIKLTFHLDATNSQYQTVQMYHDSQYYNYYDDDNDRIFELTLYPDPGQFDYFVLRDNAWGWDPHNPLHPGDIISNGAYMIVSDPMISYLLPMDGDLMRENRIQAIFAFSANNQPEINSITVTINGNTLENASQYYDQQKQILLIENPPYLVNGENQVHVQFHTPKGTASRTSVFTYQPVKLMMEDMVYRMDHILAWGRVFSSPLPDSVFVQCNDLVYQAAVNDQGYFGTDITVQSGNNIIKAAYTQAGLNDPVDVMNINAEIRHKWWVELQASISGNTANLVALPHFIDPGALELVWRNRETAEDTIPGISGTSSSITFQIPAQEGNYEIELQATDNDGQVYYARKMLTTVNTPHFIETTERAPWMESMVLYEVEGDYFDWGQYTFQKIKNTFQHMVNLGVNSFRITPFVSGGFISYDHFDIYPNYGSIDDLKDMVETAHEYGIKVFFDIPLSHVSSYHPFIQPSFLLKEAAEPFAHFVMWEGVPGESDVICSPDNGRQCVYTNLDNSYTQEYFIRLMEYWVEVAGCDGFRIDCGQESMLRAPGFIKQLHERLRNIKPELFILNEGDPRAYEEVNFYEFGDAAYSWKLNSEWGEGGEGLPGIYKGVYSVDQLHDLIVAGIPADKGLIMNYANIGYHDYLHNRYGWEQERSALALVTTTYGLVNIRAGEEVGAARVNGMFDFNDPLGTLPLYKRLVKARKLLLGNYPVIERISQNIPSDVYAYTSKAKGEILFTVINFKNQPATIAFDLNSAAFEGSGKTRWYNVTGDEMVDNTALNTFQVSLGAWEAVVYALDHDSLPMAVSPVTFRVDMQNKEVSPDGIYINGSFCNWDPDQAVKMTASAPPEQTCYTATIQLPAGDAIEYKFVNGAPGNLLNYETLTGFECAYGFDSNRSLIVPEEAKILEMICFESCYPCEPSAIGESIPGHIKIKPNPTTGYITISGLSFAKVEIGLFNNEGRLLMNKTVHHADIETLDLKALKPGIYLLRLIIDENEAHSVKIIKTNNE